MQAAWAKNLAAAQARLCSRKDSLVWACFTDLLASLKTGMSGPEYRAVGGGYCAGMRAVQAELDSLVLAIQVPIAARHSV